MSIVVYYTHSDLLPRCIRYDDHQMTDALEKCQTLRQSGFTHVTMSSEMEGQVGGNGVNAVVDGKLPNGDKYDWSKAHRAGASRK